MLCQVVDVVEALHFHDCNLTKALLLPDCHSHHRAENERRDALQIDCSATVTEALKQSVIDDQFALFTLLLQLQIQLLSGLIKGSHQGYTHRGLGELERLNE